MINADQRAVEAHFTCDDSIERGARVIEILQEIETPHGEDK